MKFTLRKADPLAVPSSTAERLLTLQQARRPGGLPQMLEAALAMPLPPNTDPLADTQRVETVADVTRGLGLPLAREQAIQGAVSRLLKSAANGVEFASTLSGILRDEHLEDIARRFVSGRANTLFRKRPMTSKQRFTLASGQGLRVSPALVIKAFGDPPDPADAEPAEPPDPDDAPDPGDVAEAAKDAAEDAAEKSIPEQFVEAAELHKAVGDYEAAADLLLKGAGHKYIKRTGSKGNYRYFYSLTDKATDAASAKKGDKFRMGDLAGAGDGHYEVTAEHDDGHVTIRHDETGSTMKLHRDDLQRHVAAEHKVAHAAAAASAMSLHQAAVKKGDHKAAAKAATAASKHFARMEAVDESLGGHKMSEHFANLAEQHAGMAATGSTGAPKKAKEKAKAKEKPAAPAAGGADAKPTETAKEKPAEAPPAAEEEKSITPAHFGHVADAVASMGAESSFGAKEVHGALKGDHGLTEEDVAGMLPVMADHGKLAPSSDGKFAKPMPPEAVKAGAVARSASDKASASGKPEDHAAAAKAHDEAAKMHASSGLKTLAEQHSKAAEGHKSTASAPSIPTTVHPAIGEAATKTESAPELGKTSSGKSVHGPTPGMLEAAEGIGNYFSGNSNRANLHEAAIHLALHHDKTFSDADHKEAAAQHEAAAAAAKKSKGLYKNPKAEAKMRAHAVMASAHRSLIDDGKGSKEKSLQAWGDFLKARADAKKPAKKMKKAETENPLAEWLEKAAPPPPPSSPEMQKQQAQAATAAKKEAGLFTPAEQEKQTKEAAAAEAAKGDDVQKALAPLLPLVRSAAAAAQSFHWRTDGTAFAGDHDLFGRVYETLADMVDPLAERIVGTEGALAVDPAADFSLTAAKLAGTTASPAGFPSEMLTRVRELADAVSVTSDVASAGTANLLQGMADKLEGLMYLLQQRSGMQKGEGDRGGHVIGHTAGGKAIYASAAAKAHAASRKAAASGSSADHAHAEAAHAEAMHAANAEGKHTEGFEHGDIAQAHATLSGKKVMDGRTSPDAETAAAHKDISTKYGSTMQKAEGSRGGHVIGHTSGGDPIYASKAHPHLGTEEHNHYKNGDVATSASDHPFVKKYRSWSAKDHKEAATALRATGSTADRHLANAHAALAKESNPSGVIGGVISHLAKVHDNMHKGETMDLNDWLEKAGIGSLVGSPPAAEGENPSFTEGNPSMKPANNGGDLEGLGKNAGSPGATSAKREKVDSGELDESLQGAGNTDPALGTMGEGRDPAFPAMNAKLPSGDRISKGGELSGNLNARQEAALAHLEAVELAKAAAVPMIRPAPGIPVGQAGALQLGDIEARVIAGRITTNASDRLSTAILERGPLREVATPGAALSKAECCGACGCTLPSMLMMGCPNCGVGAGIARAPAWSDGSVEAAAGGGADPVNVRKAMPRIVIHGPPDGK